MPAYSALICLDNRATCWVVSAQLSISCSWSREMKDHLKRWTRGSICNLFCLPRLPEPEGNLSGAFHTKCWLVYPQTPYRHPAPDMERGACKALTLFRNHYDLDQGTWRLSDWLKLKKQNICLVKGKDHITDGGWRGITHTSKTGEGLERKKKSWVPWRSSDWLAIWTSCGDRWLW